MNSQTSTGRTPCPEIRPYPGNQEQTHQKFFLVSFPGFLMKYWLLLRSRHSDAW
jgi:hypothetical protein